MTTRTVWQFVAALALVLGLLTASVGTADGEDSSTSTVPGYVPESLACIINATGLAGTAFVSVAAPPVGLWVVTVSAALAGGTLYGAIDACGSWWTTDLSNAVQIAGYCHAENGKICIPRPGGGPWGGGGGGGSWLSATPVF